MQIIGDAFAGYFKAKRRNGEFGMEIETEAKPGEYPVDFLVSDIDDPKGGWKIPIQKWKAVPDNSLRNFGVEYIFKEPYDYKEALRAIDYFVEGTKNIKFIKNAPGTSVHVHVNMFNETFLTLANFCTAYILFENVLTEYAGEMRRSNLFALPSRCSEPVVWNIVKMFEGIDKGDFNAIKWSEDEVKYGAFNIAPLSFLGSVEIRQMRGTTDEKELKEWLGMIWSLFNLARLNNVTPRDIISQYRHRNLDFFYEVFDKFAPTLEKVCKGTLIPLIDRNLYFAASIAACAKNWTVFGDKIQPKNKKNVKKDYSFPVNEGVDIPHEIWNVMVQPQKPALIPAPQGGWGNLIAGQNAQPAIQPVVNQVDWWNEPEPEQEY